MDSTAKIALAKEFIALFPRFVARSNAIGHDNARRELLLEFPEIPDWAENEVQRVVTNEAALRMLSGLAGDSARRRLVEWLRTLPEV